MLMDVGVMVDKVAVAKMSLVFPFIHWLLLFLAPQRISVYRKEAQPELKNPKATPLFIKYLLQRRCLCNLGTMVVWYLHYELGLTKEVSIGLTILPWILITLHSLLNEVTTRMGHNNRVEYVCLAVFVPAAYATLGQKEYADLTLKILYVVTLCHGVLVYVNPSGVDTLYGAEVPEDAVLDMRRWYGSDLTAVVLFGMTLLTYDVDAAKSMGIIYASYFVLTAGVMRLTDLSRLDIRPLYAWLGYMAFFGFYLLK